MSIWKQPDPTKPFAVYYDGAWWGQGDTLQGAWHDCRRQLSADHSREGAILFNRIVRHGRARLVAIVAAESVAL